MQGIGGGRRLSPLGLQLLGDETVGLALATLIAPEGRSMLTQDRAGQQPMEPAGAEVARCTVNS